MSVFNATKKKKDEGQSGAVSVTSSAVNKPGAQPRISTAASGTTTAMANLKGEVAAKDAQYVESDAVRLAKENLNSLQKPGEYSSAWQQTLNDTINKIMNREKFSYDLNGDALYQQYKDQYVNQGQQAMMDTIGQAAALTGGYGNSYAQSVGQQTYQGYLQQLNDKVPELYQLALDQYNREGEDLYNQYALLADREDTEYGRHRDTVSDWFTNRDYLTNFYNTERDFDYGQHIDNRDYAYQVARDAVADKQWQETFDRGVYEWDTSFDYQKERDSIADKQWQETFDYQKERDSIADKQWQDEFNEKVRENDRNFELTVKQIEEDIRHNKITEEQGQQQIDLAWAEHEQRKDEAEKDYEYKMASLSTKSTKEEESFAPYTYSGVDADGQSVFYRDGKKYTYERGVNPYTGTKNQDVKNGTFNNGYQPNNVGGKKLSKSGITDVVNGVTQNVWQTDDGTKYIWDGTQNRYLRYVE